MDPKAPPGAPRFGAYGYEVAGVEPEAGLVRLPGRLPGLVLSQEEYHGPQPQGCVTAVEAVLTFPRGGYAHLTRRSREARFFVPEPLSPAALVHPCLAAVCSIFSHWDGRLGFHAGAFVQADRAWAFLGGNEAGKSSLLAALALYGMPVLADDFVTLSDLRAWAGPRSIDLRAGAVEGLGLAGRLKESRSGTRWRLALGDVPSDVPLGGWFFLESGEEVSLTPISPQTRLRQLPLYRPVTEAPRDLPSLLDVAALPAWRLVRPSRWDVVNDVIDVITGTIRTLA